MGINFLQKTLNEQLEMHIKEKLPGLRTSLQKRIKELKTTLTDMGFFEDTEKSKVKLLYT
jgi:hypothetical protein